MHYFTKYTVPKQVRIKGSVAVVTVVIASRQRGRSAPATRLLRHSLHVSVVLIASRLRSVAGSLADYTCILLYLIMQCLCTRGKSHFNRLYIRYNLRVVLICIWNWNTQEVKIVLFILFIHNSYNSFSNIYDSVNSSSKTIEKIQFSQSIAFTKQTRKFYRCNV